MTWKFDNVLQVVKVHVHATF